MSVIDVDAVVVNHVQGQPQRKCVSPAVVRCQSLKYVNNVSCVDQLCSVKHVPNVQTVVKDLPVGARLNKFLETWEALGAGPKVIQVLKEGYTPPLPNLTRSPTIISCCVNPHRNLYLLEALHQLTNKCSIVGQKSQESWVFITDYFWSQNQTPSGYLY